MQFYFLGGTIKKLGIVWFLLLGHIFKPLKLPLSMEGTMLDLSQQHIFMVAVGHYDRVAWA